MTGMFACKQNVEVDMPSSKLDSVVANFSWTAVDSRDRLNELAKLRLYLAQPRLKIITKFRIYNLFCSYAYIYDKDYSKTLAYADTMVNLMEGESPRRYSEKLALAYYSKGDALFAMGNYDDSFKAYHNAKTALSINNDLCTSSDYNYRLAMVLYRQGKYHASKAYFQQSFNEANACRQDIPQIYRQQEVLANIALCDENMGHAEDAIVSAKRAVAYINQNDTIPAKHIMFDVARGVVYGCIGRNLMAKGQLQEAETYLKKSIAINSAEGRENVDAAKVQLNLIALYFDENKPKQVLAELQVLAPRLKKMKNPELFAVYHRQYSRYLYSKGNNAEAFKHLRIFVQLNDSLQVVQNKLRSTIISERFKNLDSQREIEVLSRERELKNRYLLFASIIIIMAVAIVVLVYGYSLKSKRNVAQLQSFNDQISQKNIELEKAYAKLENVLRDKDAILRTVAHDLRNPIGGISALLGLMLEEDLDQEHREQVRLMREGSANALDLINSLVVASEGSVSETPVALRKRTNLVGLVTDVVELLRFKALEKNQFIKVFTSEHSVLVNVNPEEIYRVISNLVSNAIKFSYPGGYIKVNISTERGRAVVAVADNGIGVPTSMSASVFDVFTKAKREGTHGEKSFGLGLSISQRLIAKFNGRINYAPNQEGGSIFSASLPLMAE